MDLFNKNLNSLIPYAIFAFTKVYGEEYNDIIRNKLNNVCMCIYHDVDGLDHYIKNLKIMKSREFSIKFLELIGIDVIKYKKDVYLDCLDNEMEKIIKYFFFSSDFAFDKENNEYSPLLFFNSKDEIKKDISKSNIIDEILKLINYLQGENKIQITKNNLESFINTNEYLELLDKINNYNIIYNKLFDEYEEWRKKLFIYEDYIKNERERLKQIMEESEQVLFKLILSVLPVDILVIITDYLRNGKTKKAKRAILGYLGLEIKTLIEAFSNENIEKLKDKNVNIYEKLSIFYGQRTFLSKIGVISLDYGLDINNKEKLEKWLDLLESENVKKYIPSKELVLYTKNKREELYEEAMYKYYSTRKDFKDILKNFSNISQNIKDYFCDLIRKEKICITGCGGYNDKGNFISILFYTIRKNEFGKLFYAFMHELGHVIDQNKGYNGFEIEDDVLNPYNNKNRKYERFNETLNDIFTLEAIKILNENNVYLMEQKEFINPNLINCNTSQILKDLLIPLLEKFRKEVIRAKINANHEELTKFIGKDNFEELVDIVNKVDYLCSNGLELKLKELVKDDTIIEYNNQLKRLKNLYDNIDNYYIDNVISKNKKLVKVKS